MKTPISLGLPLLLAATAFFTPVTWAQPTPTPTPTPASLSYKFKLVDPPNANETSVRGINNEEIYVGDTATTTQFNSGTENGFVAKEWFLKQFSVPASWGATDTDANDISNCNVILGMWDVNTTTVSAAHGYTLDEHGFHKLPDITDPRFGSQPDWNGINKDGVIVGVVDTLVTFVRQGFILRHGTYTFYLAPGSVNTEFNGINDRGDVVGEVDGAVGTAGVLFRNNQYSQFQFPGSDDTVAYDINNEGDIVGSYTLPTDPISQDHGFLLKGWPNHPKWYTIDGNNPTYPNTTIRTINDEEDIGGILSGNGRQGTHQDLGFVAEPAPTPKPTPTPTPTPW
jgi:hypothetical protein